MKLSIITINYKNASGLQKTMESVLNQCSDDFEYIVVDGSQLSGSVISEDKQVIDSFVAKEQEPEHGFRVCMWRTQHNTIEGGYFSEPDSGIYNAMNKGIRMARGEYIQFLNSGDELADKDVTGKMLTYLFSGSALALNHEINKGSDRIPVLYGNMLKAMPQGLYRDKSFAGRIPGMYDFYRGTLNHSPAYICRSLFDEYGLYDESLKIVSDWKWYLQVLILGNNNPVYTDVDVTIFDMSGISSTNTSLDKQERELVLNQLVPSKVLSDYVHYGYAIDQWNRIQRYRLIASFIWLLERILFKWEKLAGVRKFR